MIDTKKVLCQILNVVKKPESTYCHELITYYCGICQRWALPITRVKLLANIEPALTSRPLSGRKRDRDQKNTGIGNAAGRFPPSFYESFAHAASVLWTQPNYPEFIGTGFG